MPLEAFRTIIVLAVIWRVSQTRVLQDPHRGPISGTTFENQNPSLSTSPPVTTNQPTITNQPVATTANENKEKDELKFVKSPTDIDAMVGMPITLRCAVTGNHQPVITWSKDNRSLESDHVILRRESIRIKNAVPTDQGTYTCMAKNQIGMTATRDAKVTVSTVDQSLSSLCGQRKMLPGKTKRIIGGNNATAHWPWQVLIEYPEQSSNLLCGGSLIEKRWVLTAAHCMHSRMFWYNTGELRVRAGVYNRSEFNLQQHRLKIARIITHPKYQWDKPNYDIALLKLKNSVKMTDIIGTVCLPEPSTIVPMGTKCVTTGWGRTELGRTKLPELLQEVTVPIVSRQHCNRPKAYNKSLPKHILCAGYDKGGKDACHNDSGGPLSCYDESQKRWVLQGVTNSGIECALPNKYGIYIQVSKYIQWITNEMNAKS